VLKLRVQTDPTAATRGALRTFAYVVRNEGFGTLYAGLTPIMLRQLPYTVTKLVAYELIHRFVETTSSSERLRDYGVVFAGLLAGAAAAFVSHPADVLLTRICGTASAGALTNNVAECVIESAMTPIQQLQYLWGLGLRGAYSGFAPRLVMTSAMTSVQFTIYEATRTALGVSSKQVSK